MEESASRKAIGKVKESKVYFTTQIDQPVKLRSHVKEELNLISIPEFFYQTVKGFGNHIALVSNEDEHGNSQIVTYREYYEKVLHVSKAFIKIGVKARHSVAVLAFNCPEWFYSQMGAIHAGAVIVGIYPSTSTEVIRHILKNSKANIIVVGDLEQMNEIHQIRSSLPLLKAAIQINGPFGDYMRTEKGYYKWKDIESMEVSDCANVLNTRLNDIGINECAAIIYTSGTTGMPKGVMLTHDNFIFTTKRNVERLSRLQVGCERIVSYLPMSHIAAQLVDIFIAVELAATVYFAEANAIKGSLINIIRKARPTFFGGVPRIFEKFQENVISFEEELSFINKGLTSWAKSTALKHHLSTLNGNHSETLQYKIATHFITHKIKKTLGLDQTKVFVVGAAPSNIEMKKFFMSLDINLNEIYGCSEIAGINCYASQGIKDLNTVGKPLNGTKIKILNPNQKGHGEICFKGRCVFIGYLANERETAEVLNEDGWVQTGDIGYLNSEGDLYITGRIKEIIITSGGENIPALRIENLVKKELPILSNAFLVGERRKYLTMLVTLKTDMDPETGKPLNGLHRETREYLKKHNISYKTLSEILEAGPCVKVIECIQNGIDRANLNAISNAQRIQKFAILPHDFSIPTGELGLTLKVKRHVVCNIYEAIINS